MAFDALLSYGLELLFYAVTLLFVCYSVCLGYHWFSYGSSKTLSMLTLTVYLIGSSILFMLMAVMLSLI